MIAFMSSRTVGSAFSFIDREALVCIRKRKHTPVRTLCIRSRAWAMISAVTRYTPRLRPLRTIFFWWHAYCIFGFATLYSLP
eukprot:XP_001707993.1 Hypothetical protein GL50803_36247 [Giardia lamblia ATCC 50803]